MWKYLKRNENDEGYFEWFSRLFYYFAIAIGIIVVIIFTIIAFVSCEQKAEGIVERQKNKMMKCVDTRDGEVFYFNTNTVHNIYIGYGSPHRYDVVTSNGDTMTLKSDMEIYLKCKECKNDSIINKIKELYYERTIINN